MNSTNLTLSIPKSSKNSTKCFLAINLVKGVAFSVSAKIPYLLKGDALGNIMKFLKKYNESIFIWIILVSFEWVNSL